MKETRPGGRMMRHRGSSFSTCKNSPQRHRKILYKQLRETSGRFLPLPAWVKNEAMLGGNIVRLNRSTGSCTSRLKSSFTRRIPLSSLFTFCFSFLARRVIMSEQRIKVDLFTQSVWKGLGGVTVHKCSSSLQ